MGSLAIVYEMDARRSSSLLARRAAGCVIDE